MRPKLWVIADSHFQHKNICAGTTKWAEGGNLNCRDFDTTEEMDDCIIDNINSMVMPEDILWHLGDFAFGDKNNIPELRHRIKCKTIHFIYGNHDECISGIHPRSKPLSPEKLQRAKMFQGLFASVQHYKEMFYKGKLIVMFHFPIASWNGIGKGAIHFHGHSHGSFEPVGRMIDVGVDPQNFQPISFDDSIDVAESRDIVLVDHHNQNTSIG